MPEVKKIVSIVQSKKSGQNKSVFWSLTNGGVHVEIVNAALLACTAAAIWRCSLARTSFSLVKALIRAAMSLRSRRAK